MSLAEKTQYFYDDFQEELIRDIYESNIYGFYLLKSMFFQCNSRGHSKGNLLTEKDVKYGGAVFINNAIAPLVQETGKTCK